MISIITGGISGIGSVIATTLRTRGDEVYTVSRRKIEDDNHISADLSTQEGIKILSSKFKDTLIDNLIFAHRYRGTDAMEEFQLTVKSVNDLIWGIEQLFNFHGSIIILGSKASNLVFSEQPYSYHATRGALQSMTSYYAVNLGKKGIRCNCVIPGVVTKPENTRYFEDESNSFKTILEDITPMGRLSKSEDVSYLIRYLCSQDAQNITGQCITVDGGLSLVSQEDIGRETFVMDDDL